MKALHTLLGLSLAGCAVNGGVEPDLGEDVSAAQTTPAVTNVSVTNDRAHAVPVIVTHKPKRQPFRVYMSLLVQDHVIEGTGSVPSYVVPTDQHVMVDRVSVACHVFAGGRPALALDVADATSPPGLPGLLSYLPSAASAQEDIQVINEAVELDAGPGARINLSESIGATGSYACQLSLFGEVLDA